MKALLSATALAAFALSATASFAETNLTYMMWGDPPEIAVWEAIVGEFEAANPDIKVKVEVSDWDSYWDKLRVTTVGGNPPDVFAMDAPLYPDWQSRGSLLDLSPYLKAAPETLNGVYPGPLSAYQLAAGTFGLPRDFQTIVLFYNKAMFDAAGVAYPDDSWTLDDLRAAAKKLTIDKDGDGHTDQWGLGTELWDMEPMWGPVVYSYGGAPISADFKKTTLGEAPAAEAWKFLADFRLDDGSVMSTEDLESYGNDGFLAGVAAMTFTGHWNVPGYSALTFDWDVTPFPRARPAAPRWSIAPASSSARLHPIPMRRGNSCSSSSARRASRSSPNSASPSRSSTRLPTARPISSRRPRGTTRCSSMPWPTPTPSRASAATRSGRRRSATRWRWSGTAR